MRAGLLITMLVSLFVTQTSLAGAPGPFEACQPVNEQTLQTVSGTLRERNNVQYEVGLKAIESECSLSGVVTGYTYNVVIQLKLPLAGMIDASLNKSPIMIQGNFMFKDKTQANQLAQLSLLNPTLSASCEDTYSASLHASGRVKRVGLDQFVQSIRGYSFHLVSDDVPTTRIQSIN